MTAGEMNWRAFASESEGRPQTGMILASVITISKVGLSICNVQKKNCLSEKNKMSHKYVSAQMNGRNR